MCTVLIRSLALSLSFALSLSHPVSMSHTKMFYKQFSSWFLCVFVHSFNYLGIKYDDPGTIWRGTAGEALVAKPQIVGTLWPRVGRPRVLVASFFVVLFPISCPIPGKDSSSSAWNIFIVSCQFCRRSKYSTLTKTSVDFFLCSILSLTVATLYIFLALSSTVKLQVQLVSLESLT